MTVRAHVDYMLLVLQTRADGEPWGNRAASKAAANLLGLHADARTETFTSGIAICISRS